MTSRRACGIAAVMDVADFLLDREVQHGAAREFGRVHILFQESERAGGVDREVDDADIDAFVDAVVVEVVVQARVGHITPLHYAPDEVYGRVVLFGIFLFLGAHDELLKFQVAVFGVCQRFRRARGSPSNQSYYKEYQKSNFHNIIT